MRVDPLLPASEKNGPDAGDDKIRINSSSLDHPVVILADQSLEIVVIGKPLYCTNREAALLHEGPAVGLLAQHRPDRHGRGGLPAGAKVTVSRDGASREVTASRKG